MKKGILFLTISSFIFVSSGYIINIFLGRFLGPTDYGFFGIIVSILGIVNIIQSNGIPTACAKFLSEKKQFQENIYKSCLYLQLIVTFCITIFFFLLAYPIADAFNDPNLVYFIRLISITLPLYSLYTLYIGYYNGLHLFKQQSLLTIVYSFSKLVAVLTLGFLFHLIGAIWGVILSSIIPLLISIRIPNWKAGFFSFRLLITFSIPIIGFSLFTFLQQSVDLYFVKAMIHADEQTGYYTASQNLSKVSFFAFSAFSGVILPHISKNIGLDKHQENRIIIHQTLRVMIMLLMPFTALVSATSTNLLALLYSDVYIPAASSLSILVIGLSILTISTLMASILNGANKPMTSFFTSILGLITTCIFCTLLIPKFGLVGAASATTIGAFMSLILATFYVYKLFHALINPIRFLKIIGSSLIIFILAVYIPTTPYFLPILYFFLISVYVLLLIMFKELTKYDLTYIYTHTPIKKILNQL